MSSLKKEEEMSKQKDKPMPNIAFRFMSFGFKLRDRFINPKKVLEKVGVREGQTVLDFGCGPGSYTIPAAKLVYDIIHMIKDKRALLKEPHRVIKSGGILSILVGHIKVDSILEIVNEDNLFALRNQSGKLLNFEKRS
jgi:ubiquinone/menaquinone biosynthesis C-methylase UbiE